MATIDFGDGGDYTPTPQPAYGGSAFDRVRNIYNRVTGGQYNPSEQEVSQFGSDIDPQYESKIERRVNDWWLDYQRQQKPTPQTPPTTTPPPSGPPPLSGRTSDDNTILAYISQWANEADADPSLRNDPNYWLRRIKETGGLGSDNLDYWHKASVGSTAFYRNPSRESGTGGTTTGIPGLNISSYDSMFNDPATKQLEDWMSARLNELKQPVNDPSREALARLLDQQTAMFQAQRAAQEQAAAGLRARQAAAMQSADEFVNFAKQRAQKLQGPAYTGAESEVFRTQALDPIEADRQAAQQRALQNISARGMDPTSGIAQQLLNDVNASFDRSRAGVQNQLAYKQIEEQRSREQEAQQLLGYIPQAQSAAARGDLEFLQSLDAAVNQPEQGAIASAGQSAALGQGVRDEQQVRRQEALAISSMLQQLPTLSLQQAMAAIGQGPSPESLANIAIQLYGIGQNQRNQGLSWYQSLGMALPYLSGIYGRGTGSGGGYNGMYNYSGGG